MRRFLSRFLGACSTTVALAFEDFVYFYHDKQEYIEIIQRLSSEGFPVKYSQKQRKDFLEQNTWECRIQEIMKYIK